MDNSTPQSAIVIAKVDGRTIEVDFLTHVLVRPNALAASAAEFLVPIRSGEANDILALPVMHPLRCLQSRIANVLQLGRRDDVSRRQLEAAPIVIREYLSEMLNTGEHDEAIQTLQRLFECLRSDMQGREAHRHKERDPAQIIGHFASDERLDERYRRYNVAPMQKGLAERRTIRARLRERRDGRAHRLASGPLSADAGGRADDRTRGASVKGS